MIDRVEAPASRFTLTAIVRNAGDGASAGTTLRYYRSTDATIATSDTAAGTDSVAGLAASGSSSQSVDLTAPSTSGTYYYGACVDAVAGESDTTNNCSASVQVTVSEVEPPPPSNPDLVVESPSVDDSSSAAGASFTLSATVRNAGDGASAGTTLRYYRSTDATIATSDTAAGTDPVAGLAASGSSSQSVDLTAPSTSGTWYYGACVDAVAGESDTANNCSASVRVTVSAVEPPPPPPPSNPDLVVESPSVDDSSSAAGASFTLSATVRNAGDGASAGTTLRYYRSTDATIATSDTAAGTDSVAGLAASGSSSQSVDLTAPSTSGTYYYGACVDAVAGESDTTNNCSASVQVTVSEVEPPPPSNPDLVVESPSVNDSSPAAGASFTLSATVRNAGDGASAGTTLRYYRSTDATIATSDTAAGTDSVAGLAASGSSSQSVDLTAPSTSGTWYYGACVDAVAGESDTTNNCSASVRVTVSEVEPPPQSNPDLVVESPSVNDSSSAAGASFTLSATVRNAGDGASAATMLRYYRSTDAAIATSDTAEGTDPVAGLAASGSSSQSVDLTAPSTSGTYYYGACVDAVAGESDTANNCSASVRVTVSEVEPPPPSNPDLVVESPSVNDSGPAAGASFTLSATVRNAGDGASAGTTLRYYRSTDATIATSDTAAGTDSVAGLAASGSSSQSVDLTAPSTSGTWYYGACVDAVAGESDTTNNCSASVQVTVSEVEPPPPPSNPDLVVESPSVNDSSPAAGASFTLSATVRNAGDGASAGTTLRYYRSTDATIATSDTAAGTDPVAGLAASGSVSHSVALTAPSTSGTYYYGACVDAMAGESDTTNNCSASVRVTVSEVEPPPPSNPDLVVESPSVDDSSPAAGASFTLSATVRNAGDGASAGTTLRYYRSTDATIAMSDRAAGTDSVAGLAASGSVSHSVALTAPSTSGTYYYGACVDAMAGESDTTNNCSASVRVTVSEVEPPPQSNPDLVVESPSVDDSSPAAGASFTLSATVRNAGDGASAGTTLRYYRSTDATIATSDTAAGTDPVAGLAASGSSSQSVDLTAPSTSGTWYYGACVDAVAGESDTTNNCSASVQVTVSEVEPPPPSNPDLVVESPSVNDSSPAAGASFTLSATVRNAGDGASAGTTLRYYRSTDATIATSDTAAGTDPVAGLAASGSSSQSVDLTAPSTSGTWYYGACVDAVAGESDTANNCSASVRVTVSEVEPPPQSNPDLVVESPSVDDSSPAAGAGFTLSATVRNAGDGASAGTTLRYYRSTDATITSSDAEVGTGAVEGLSAGASSGESIGLTAPSSGTYDYGACVDAVAGESDTTNNCSGSVQVTVSGPPPPPPPPTNPDLVVGRPAVTDSSLETGDSFTLAATVSNVGDGASAGTTLRYYRSTDATITTSDTAEGTDSVAGLAASGSSSHSAALTAPSTSGTWYYGACVDAVAGESDTANNCSAPVTVTVYETQPPVGRRPDLIVSRARLASLNPFDRPQFRLAATVRNDGDGASPPATLRFYRSTDATITPSDSEVGTEAVEVLAASGRRTVLSVDLIAPTTPGTHYFGACVDAVANESDTTNNCGAPVEFPVSAPQRHPDLTVSRVWTIPYTPEALFVLLAEVTNEGDGPSLATTLRYYRSTDAAITTSDTMLGTYTIGWLPPSKTGLGTETLTVPSMPGTYYYGACVDAVANESDTTNNCSSGAQVVVPRPVAPARAWRLPRAR